MQSATSLHVLAGLIPKSYQKVEQTGFKPRNSGLLEAASGRGRQCVGHAAAVAGGPSGNGHEASPVQDGVDSVRVGARHERLRIILEQEAAVCLVLVFLITVI